MKAVRNSDQKIKVAVLITCMWSFTAFAQISPDRLQQYISENKYNSNTAVKEFYERLNYKTAWTRKENKTNSDIFFNALRLSADLGLSEKDYQLNYIESLRRNKFVLQTIDDSLEAELRITDAAIHFYNDIAYGNIKPVLGYDGLNYVPGCRNIPVLLAYYISGNLLQSSISYLSPSFPEITAMKKKIMWFRNVMSDSNFREVTIISNKVNATNKQLITKLHQLGIIDSVDSLYRTKL